MTADVSAFTDWAHWLQWQDHHRPALHAEAAANAHLQSAADAQQLRGECALCALASTFDAAALTDGATRSLRESLACRRCHCNARQRAVALVLLDRIASRAGKLYVTEQASHFYVQLRRRFPSLHGSEFTASTLRRMRVVWWLLRHGVLAWPRLEDVTRLSFDTASMDAVASLDVLEHVPDAARALREFARVLRPRGLLLLTVPFHADHARGETLARLHADGSIEHLQPPEFHGDPMGRGVLCFHHFAWDLLEQLRGAGFREAAALRVRDPDAGLPEAQWVLRAVR